MHIITLKIVLFFLMFIILLRITLFQFDLLVSNCIFWSIIQEKICLNLDISPVNIWASRLSLIYHKIINGRAHICFTFVGFIQQSYCVSDMLPDEGCDDR